MWPFQKYILDIYNTIDDLQHVFSYNIRKSKF